MKDWLKLFEKISEYHWQQNVLPVWEKYENGKLPWQSVAIFLSTYAYERSGVNPNYAPTAEDIIQEGLKEIEENNHDLESSLWKFFCKKMKYGEDKGYGGLNYGRNPLSPYPSKTETKSDGKSLFARMKQEKIGNLIVDLQELTTLEAFSFLRSIRGIGPKISSFFLRDMSEKSNKKSTKDRELLQPIDVWIRRIIFKIRNDNWGAKSEYDNRYDKEIAEWIVEEAKKEEYNPERINMGMWYFGSQVCGKSKYKFDQIFRDFESAEQAWETYYDRIKRICSLPSRDEFGEAILHALKYGKNRGLYKDEKLNLEHKRKLELHRNQENQIFTQLSKHP